MIKQTLYRKACQILSGLPEPVPIAGALVGMVVLAGLASCVPKAQAQDSTAAGMQLQPGQIVQCMAAEGCFIFTTPGLVAYTHDVAREVAAQLAKRAPLCRRDDDNKHT